MSVQARNTGLLTPEVIWGKHVSSQESKIVQLGLLKLPFLSWYLLSLTCLFLWVVGSSSYFTEGFKTVIQELQTSWLHTLWLNTCISTPPVFLLSCYKSCFYLKRSLCHWMWHPPLSSPLFRSFYPLSPFSTASCTFSSILVHLNTLMFPLLK